MAGHSAKKTLRNAETMTQYYMYIAICSVIVNLVGIVLSRQWSSLIGSMAVTGLTGFSSLMIKSALELGVGYELWQDLFIVSVLVLVLSVISNYAWFLLLAIPAYGLWTFGGYLYGWAFPGRSAASPEVTPPRRNTRR